MERERGRVWAWALPLLLRVWVLERQQEPVLLLLLALLVLLQRAQRLQEKRRASRPCVPRRQRLFCFLFMKKR